MKIAIISDTHGNVANFKKVINWLNRNNINLILHCGDIGSPESLKESLLDFKGDFFGVFGNMDKDFKTCSVKSREAGILPEAKLFNRVKIEEYNKIPKVKINEDILETEIGDPPSSRLRGTSARRRKIAITHYPDAAKKMAQSQKYDLVFYGHTHRPWEERIGDCRMINPGELAGQFYKPTFAVYDTDIDELELKILEKL